MFEFNKDHIQRDKLLGITHQDYDIVSINIDFYLLKQLIELKFIYPYENQNYSPTIKKFYDFMQKYPEIKAHGYAVTIKRKDYRVSLDGLEGKGIKDFKCIQDFINDFHGADEFTVDFETGYLYCWWD